MIPMTLAEIAEATGGTLAGGAAGPGTGPDAVLVDGPVVTDSREAGPGSLYVARVGEHADGHDYVAGAVAGGAVAVLGTRVVDDTPTVLVHDVQEAFATLARAVLERATDLAVVGITGSSGKTSTKDLLAGVLRPAGPTVAPVGSFNSEVGVPLTVCRVEQDTRFLVAEMGADGVGHIAYLTGIAPPQVGIVLNVGQAHLGSFGSVEAIARTKGELVEALPADGLAVLNADDERVRAMAARASCPVVLVGRSADADYRASDISTDDLGRPRFTVHTPQGHRQVQLEGLSGEHQVGNALSVLAAAVHLGVDLDEAITSLRTARPASRWRMELFDLPEQVTLINDAYNANPDSMRAALAALARIGSGGRRTWAVLGAMRELGDASEAEHRGVGGLAAQAGIDRLLVVGDGATGIGDGAIEAGMAPGAVQFATDVDAAHALLTDGIASQDVVLLKSSRDSGLRFLGDRIVTESGQEVAP